jgi:hypothetical protein
MTTSNAIKPKRLFENEDKMSEPTELKIPAT